MGKIGFLYPGQGSQKVGMGKELAASHMALFERYLRRIDEVVGLPISQLCLEGPADVLSQTQIAQPALFAYSLALTDYAARLGIFPTLVAGHSLGEYTAAVAAGAISFEDGLRLVCNRGRLMKQQQDEQPGTMAAVLGLAKETLDELCLKIARHHPVLVTNWNAPGQLVVSGTEQGVYKLIEEVRGHGAGKAIPLPVKGAFHSPLMEPVQKAMHLLTEALYWSTPLVPLVSNVSGKILTQGAEIRQELVEQITSPVQWVRCVETLAASGCDTLIELGSGQVLSKLVRLTAPHMTVTAIDTPEKLEAFAHSQRAADLQVA